MARIIGVMGFGIICFIGGYYFMISRIDGPGCFSVKRNGTIHEWLNEADGTCEPDPTYTSNDLVIIK